MDVLCPLDALLKCGGFCKPLKDAMKSDLLSYQQEMTSRTTSTKRMWLSDFDCMLPCGLDGCDTPAHRQLRVGRRGDGAVMEEVSMGKVIPIRSASTEALNFVVGRDKFGRWIVTEVHGLYGGIFANREAAVRFVALELGGRPGSLSISKVPLELFAKYRRAA